jgi:molybdopterin converting factor subunit 1
MRCEVILFAHVREAVGKDRLVLDLPDGATVCDAIESLSARHESVAAMRGRLAVAVNQRYADSQSPLHEGDVLALIPPVSGG